VHPAKWPSSLGESSDRPVTRLLPVVAQPHLSLHLLERFCIPCFCDERPPSPLLVAGLLVLSVVSFSCLRLSNPSSSRKLITEDRALERQLWHRLVSLVAAGAVSCVTIMTPTWCERQRACGGGRPRQVIRGLCERSAPSWLRWAPSTRVGNRSRHRASKGWLKGGTLPRRFTAPSLLCLRPRSAGDESVVGKYSRPTCSTHACPDQ